jgi:2-phospho-L-lactate guanylyltransferase
VTHEWVVLLPLKRLTGAKSRLTLPCPDNRGDVARAMAETVAAMASRVPGVRSVVVVTDEAWDHSVAPAVVIPEPAEPGLNAALAHAADSISRRWPRSGIAALLADTAAGTAAELHACLTRASRHPRAVVADHAGTGTVLLTAGPGVRLDPRFGAGSRQAHVVSGAVDLTDRVDVPMIRRDLDTTADLAAVHGRLTELTRLSDALVQAGWAVPDHPPAVVRATAGRPPRFGRGLR